MEIIETRIQGLRILKTSVHRDERGYFLEMFRSSALLDAGIDIEWTQDNLSVSHRKVVRGMHYQVEHPQAKLVQVAHGALFDLVIDLRRSSPTFGNHVSVELKAGDGAALLIPIGCAHGFAALQSDTALLYKVSDSYCPQGERTILWNDPDLGIVWPFAEDEVIISEKDRRGSLFKHADVFP